MKLLKTFFPLSFTRKRTVADLIVNVLIQLVLCAIISVLIVIFAMIPVVGIVFGIVGGLVGLYEIAGIVFSVLHYLKVLK